MDKLLRLKNGAVIDLHISKEYSHRNSFLLLHLFFFSKRLFPLSLRVDKFCFILEDFNFPVSFSDDQETF